MAKVKTQKSLDQIVNAARKDGYENGYKDGFVDNPANAAEYQRGYEEAFVASKYLLEKAGKAGYEEGYDAALGRLSAAITELTTQPG